MLVCNLTFKYTLNKNEEEDQNSQIQPKIDEIYVWMMRPKPIDVDSQKRKAH